MAETAFTHNSLLAQAVVEPRTIEISPAVVDAVIAVGGVFLFAAAGVLLGAYLMLPVELG